MNAHQKRTLESVRALRNEFEITQNLNYLNGAARLMAFLCRSARSDKARLELLALADGMNLRGLSAFVVHYCD